MESAEMNCPITYEQARSIAGSRGGYALGHRQLKTIQISAINLEIRKTQGDRE